MGDDVCVSRAVVIEVLELYLNKSNVKFTDGMLTVYTAQGIRSWLLPEQVPSRFVRELANRFKISPHHFWHPEMIHQGKEEGDGAKH